MKITKGQLPITSPGIFSSISLDAYHSTKVVAPGEYAVSSTDLRTMRRKSPAHMYDQWPYNPNFERPDPNDAMILGATLHHLVMGESKFPTKYVMQPAEYRDLKTAQLKKWTYQAQWCKDWRTEQERKGRTIVTAEQLGNIKGMARSLQLEPAVSELEILKGDCECSGFVKDPETGLWIKVRPDVMVTDGDFVDLKSAREVTDVGIRMALRDRQYHMQGGLIWLACDLLKIPFITFTLIFVESKRPFCVRAVPLHDDDISRGLRQCRAMLRKTARCIDTGLWPGPGDGEMRSISLPLQEQEAIDKELAYEEAMQ